MTAIIISLRHDVGCLRMRRAYRTNFCFCEWIREQRGLFDTSTQSDERDMA